VVELLLIAARHETTQRIMMRKKDEVAFGRIPAYCKYELFMERYRSAAEIIRDAMPLNENVKFLDVGCGEGNMKYFFDAREGQWHGIECWQKRADICRDLGYEVVDIDINETLLPYLDAHFDVVIASHVIEHLSNVEFALKEMDRVLKKGGIMLIATPTKPPGTDWVIEFFHNLQSKDLGRTQHAFSAFSLKRFIGRILKNYELIDCRGMRVLSMRKRFKLENLYSFYRVNTFLAKYLTFMVPEVNLIYKKTI
jgi:ubiquinone/menaquinone biosynthesis C-methylase UbiE